MFPNTGDNESRAIIQPQSLNDPAVKELIAILIEWINDELADERIIVKDIEEDLYDGQILHKLLEKLTGRKLDVPEVTQSEEGQRQKLQIVLNAVNHVRPKPNRRLEPNFIFKIQYNTNIYFLDSWFPSKIAQMEC